MDLIKHHSRALASLTLLLLLTQSGVATAFHLPLWELGAGAGVISAPHYRGSKTIEEIYLPFPFITYRGDYLKVDRDGIRSELFDSDRIRLDVSLAGNIPVPETDDSARAGMPGLDPLGEIGPELQINLWRDTAADASLWLKFPYRLIFSVGEPLMEYQGWSFSPYINYRKFWGDSSSLQKLTLSAGPIFAGNKYHDYFYEVEPQYVTPDRQQYNADTGYSGSRITLTYSINQKKYFLATFARYDNISNATFEDSPLVETRDYFIFGIAFAWKFTASSEKVPHEDH